eukprot:GHVS01099654.1.p1 GENE.GHVS01099654.1~~GHVS01099654.1.p1  ORF type:complete len:104 (-),score=10.77 GHVS01099654.1:128-439(-)
MPNQNEEYKGQEDLTKREEQQDNAIEDVAQEQEDLREETMTIGTSTRPLGAPASTQTQSHIHAQKPYMSVRTASVSIDEGSNSSHRHSGNASQSHAPHCDFGR